MRSGGLFLVRIYLSVFSDKSGLLSKWRLSIQTERLLSVSCICSSIRAQKFDYCYIIERFLDSSTCVLPPNAAAIHRHICLGTHERRCCSRRVALRLFFFLNPTFCVAVGVCARLFVHAQRTPHSGGASRRHSCSSSTAVAPQ